MKIIYLNEADIETTSEYSRGEDERRAKATELFKTSDNVEFIKPIEDIVIDSIVNFGTENNDFLDFVLNIRFPIKANQKDHFDFLYRNSKLYDFDKEWFYKRSLYNRPLDDFKYTVNAFNTASDKTKLRNYFRDTSKIDINEFYTPSGEIKPAGRNGAEGDTIWNVIENWGKDNTFEESRHVSLQTIFDQNNVAEYNQGDTLYKWIKDNQSKFKYNPRHDIDMYKLALNILFDPDLSNISSSDPKAKQKLETRRARDYLLRTKEFIDDSDLAHTAETAVQILDVLINRI